MERRQSWHLNLKIANEANSTEHWTKKSKRHRIQKRKVAEAFLMQKLQLQLPLTVILTRIAPRRLDDHDNLRMSLKWVSDSIADFLIPGKAHGRADDSKDISWEYKQEKGSPKEYALIIEMVENFSGLEQ